MKAVAYLDLLGFSNAVLRNAEEALAMLNSYNSILHFGIVESELHPSSGYPPELQKLAKRSSTESFKDFLPFSDSIFITSDDCSDFLLQLGEFLYKSFHLTAHFYAHPENEKDPIETRNIGLGDDGNGGLTVVEAPCRIPPALFRGGVAFGDVNHVKPTALIDGNRTEGYILVGDAVVKAVGMEKAVKGPRIVFGNEVFEQLNDDARLYTRSLPEDSNLFELLWPGMPYILENPMENEFSYFCDMFIPVYNLWSYYKNDRVVSVQYERFIELVVASALRLYSHVGMNDFALEQIGKVIDGKFSGAEMTKIFGYLNVFGRN